MEALLLPGLSWGGFAGLHAQRSVPVAPGKPFGMPGSAWASRGACRGIFVRAAEGATDPTDLVGPLIPQTLPATATKAAVACVTGSTGSASAGGGLAARHSVSASVAMAGAAATAAAATTKGGGPSRPRKKRRGGFAEEKKKEPLEKADRDGLYEAAVARAKPGATPPEGFHLNGFTPPIVAQNLMPSRFDTPTITQLRDSDVKDLEWITEQAILMRQAEIASSLRDRGWWISQGHVLPQVLRKDMRHEVEALWNAGKFLKSQSVRGTEYYDKENVFATEVSGLNYDLAPRLAHYTTSVVQALQRLIREDFPEVNLSPNLIGNKLNVCIGSGAAFDPHLDTGVGEGPLNRKLTLLLYLNPAWRPELGGELTLLGETSGPERPVKSEWPESVTPVDGRWAIFWSEQMLHKVEPSWAPKGAEDYRISYTIWLCGRDAEKPFPKSDGFEQVPVGQI